MQTDEKDFLLSSYDYHLPEERIAQYPPEDRSSSRLMVLDRESGRVTHSVFRRLGDFLGEGTLLVANNSRVVPARIFGARATGGKAELLLLTPPPLLESAAAEGAGGAKSAQAEVLLKPGRHIHPGDDLSFAGGIRAHVLKKKEFGMHDVLLQWQGSLVATLDAIGRIPLPPYIRRDQEEEDLERYQTLYARREKSGSVAAPTAGLHFTEELRAELQRRGIGWTEVTLHVGYGTFSPVREEHIERHPMHSEYAEIPPAAAAAIAKAKREKRPVVAVGTTSCRTLEGCALACGGCIPPEGWKGRTNIFIHPGYRFQVIDKLITNFHLPKSTLLMLVAALCGREAILAAYEEAVREQYRFFSYGDAMLIL